MEIINRHPSSFRDPAGTVFSVGKRIIRGLSDEGYARYSAVKNTGLLDYLEKNKKIISSTEFNEIAKQLNYVQYIEHELIDFISYPYEWPFLLLKEAALLHLHIQIKALEKNVSLIDASAYNIQFNGVNPLFIDILSFRTYEQGEFWNGHRQFCDHFLNPLLLYSVKGIPYQDWYRGSLEGIATELLAPLLPFKSWLSLRSIIHILLPARSQNKAKKSQDNLHERTRKLSFPKSVYLKFLHQLYAWIKNLKMKSNTSSIWEDYTSTRIYTENQIKEKQNIIAEFILNTNPSQLWDLGCNDGEFAEIALQSGAKYVVGFDSDLKALDNAVLRAKKNNLNFLPLYQQLTNFTPNQGWLSKERLSILDRGSPDALIALALIHHLALANNIPLQEIIQLLTSIAPKGIIEFVPKSDPTAQRMLFLKGDLFPTYTEENFRHLLSENARIIKTVKLSDTNRTLYWFQTK